MLEMARHVHPRTVHTDTRHGEKEKECVMVLRVHVTSCARMSSKSCLLAGALVILRLLVL